VPGNSIVLTNLATNATVGLPIITGDVTGSLDTTAILADTTFFNELLTPVVLGTFMSFGIDVSRAYAGGVPDNLSVFLLDPAATMSVVSTDLPGDALMSIDLNGSATGAITVASSPVPGVGVTVSTGPVQAPEPSTLVPFGALLGALIGWRCLQRTRGNLWLKGRAEELRT
jgi:hypothetical protein